MSKKNLPTRYTTSTQSSQYSYMSRFATKIISDNIWAFTLQLLGLLVFVANLWLVSQLAPIRSSVELVQAKQEAQEEEIKNNSREHEGDITLLRDDIVYIRGRLDTLFPPPRSER